MLQPFGSGSYIVLPAGQPHFARMKDGATVQISGMGPFTLQPAVVARSF